MPSAPTRPAILESPPTTAAAPACCATGNSALGESLEGGFVHVVGRQDQGRDVAAANRVGEMARSVAHRRGDQHDAAAVRRGLQS